MNKNNLIALLGAAWVFNPTVITVKRDEKGAMYIRLDLLSDEFCKVKAGVAEHLPQIPRGAQGSMSLQELVGALKSLA